MTEPQLFDHFLRSLVYLVNETPGFEFGITLTVSGATITGTAIGWREYFEQTAKAIKETPGNSRSKNIADAFASIFDAQVLKGNEQAASDPESVQEPRFIHLRDARLVFGTQAIPSGHGTLWRGRLSSVDGFSIGRVSGMV